MNNWFVYLSVFEELYDKVIAETIQDNNFSKPVGFSYYKNQSKRINVENYSQVDIFSSIVEQCLVHEPDIEYIRYVEQEYAISTLSLSIFADRHIGYNNKFTYKQKLALIELTFKYAIKLNEKYSFKFAWFESVGGFASYILYLVFKKSNVKICIIVFDQFPGKIATSQSERLIWDGVEEEMQAIGNESPPSQEEIMDAQSFLRHFRETLPAPSAFSKNSIPKITFKDFSRGFTWAQDYFSDKYNVLAISPLQMVFTKFKKIFRGRASSFLFSKLDTKNLGDYVFFPLHFQPEMTTLVCAPYCLNQVSVIEDIAKSLPAGIRLVVKEHHASVGRRPLQDYREIKKNWNVILVRPQENALELIKASKAVITINSTVGLEGLLLGRPVITLARVGYDASPIIIRGHKTGKEHYSQMIADAINSQPNEQDIINFCIAVNRVLVTAHEDFELLHPTYARSVLDVKNVTRIADIIKKSFMTSLTNK